MKKRLPDFAGLTALIAVAALVVVAGVVVSRSGPDRAQHLVGRA